MRVLVVGAAIDRVECGLFTGLKRRGVDLEIVCEASSPHLAALREAAIPIVHQTIKSKLDLKASARLRERLASGAFDLVYALTARALTTTLWATRGTRQRVAAYRGTVGHLSRLDPSSYLGFLNRRIGLIICVSHAVEAYLGEKGVPADRRVTIYKGHDPEWYAGERANLAEFGVPSGASVVACTANMRPVKGVDVLVEAFGRIRERTAAHLLLIGEVRDPKIHRLVDMHRLNGRVHFTGYRKDAPAIVRSCDAFVMPSRAREGLPKAVIEAMCVGVPPIVTAVGGMPELVRDRFSGLVVPPSDSTALGEAVCALLSDDALRARLRRGAFEAISGDFSIERTIEKTAAAFGQLIGREP